MNFARRCLVVLAAVTASAAPAFTAPAYAHHGYAGPALLYLESVRLEPAPAGGWQMRAALNDSKSGQASPGFLVEAAGSGPQRAAFGPVTLTDVDSDGRYEAPLGDLPPGDWSLSVHVADAPGGERAIPLNRSWAVALTPGLPVDIFGRASGGDGSSGGSIVPTLLALGGGTVLLGLTATWLKRRPRKVATIPTMRG